MITNLQGEQSAIDYSRIYFICIIHLLLQHFICISVSHFLFEDSHLIWLSLSLSLSLSHTHTHSLTDSLSLSLSSLWPDNMD